MQTFALNKFHALSKVLTLKMLLLNLNQKSASILEHENKHLRLFFDKNQDPF